MSTTSAPGRTAGLSWTADARLVPDAQDRLRPPPDTDRFAGWVTTVVITLLAGFLRLWELGRPRAFLFDETYYAKDAWSLLHHGYVTGYVKDANDQILAGHVDDLFTASPSMVVHPEAGKWLIALGEQVFGMTPFGWRVASAVAGTLMVLVVIRLARRLTRSTLLGGVAGLLLCFDGLQFVLSRLALLDIFMALFLLCAAACLVADRDWFRSRLADLVPVGHRTSTADWGPVRAVLWRPWRVGAGVFFGLACATKWNALFPLLAFGVLAWLWDAGARRAVGVRSARLRALVADALPSLLTVLFVAILVYVASWTGWLLHADVYERSLSDTQYGPYWGTYLEYDAHGFFPELWQSLRSLWNYHQDVYTFHTRFLDEAKHTYQSHPQGWPILSRPVGVEADLGIKPGAQGCDAPADSTCLRQVLLLGTPTLWWGGVLTLLYSLYAWLGKRDWRFGFAVVGFVATWLPWFRYDERPIFLYYAVAMIPFTVIAVTLTLGTMIGGPRASYRRRTWGTALAGAFLVLVVLNFAWFWPIYTGELITTPDWLDRVWFKQWI